jgi:hypothetical protein
MGLANVRQRLDLAYPGRHTLTLIEPADRPGPDEYGVRLVIKL